jgi:hypothetical protein
MFCVHLYDSVASPSRGVLSHFCRLKRDVPSARLRSCWNTGFVRKSSLAKSISVCSPKIAPLVFKLLYTT